MSILSFSYLDCISFSREICSASKSRVCLACDFSNGLTPSDTASSVAAFLYSSIMAFTSFVSTASPTFTCMRVPSSMPASSSSTVIFALLAIIEPHLLPSSSQCFAAFAASSPFPMKVSSALLSVEMSSFTPYDLLLKKSVIYWSTHDTCFSIFSTSRFSGTLKCCLASSTAISSHCPFTAA